MEIYHLLPNTTYEFRIWGNNYIGPGEIATTIVTTLPEIGDDGNYIPYAPECLSMFFHLYLIFNI